MLNDRRMFTYLKKKDKEVTDNTEGLEICKKCGNYYGESNRVRYGCKHNKIPLREGEIAI